MFGVNQVEIGDMVDDAAVDLFGDVEIEAAVAGFHVEDGDVHPFCHISRQAGIGIAQDQHGVRHLFPQHLLRFADDIADGGTQGRGVYFKEIIGFADFKVFEEDLVELVIVILPGMDEDVIDVLVEKGYGSG